MVYACPVCAEPQADGEHLANHLAFSAMLGRADHADWLDEYAPDWDAEGPEELAERVTPHADAVEHPAVDDDAELPDPLTGAQGAGGPQGGLEDAIARGGGPGRERLDPETRETIEKARAMTRQGRGDEARDAAASEAGDGSVDPTDGRGDEGDAARVDGEDDAAADDDDDARPEGAGDATPDRAGEATGVDEEDAPPAEDGEDPSDKKG